MTSESSSLSPHARDHDVAADRQGAFAFDLFTTPRRHERPAREQAWLVSARRYVVSRPAGDIPAWLWGPANAPAVLLVHGWEGRGSQLGAFAAPLLARGYRVIAVDMPAHGDAPGERATLVDFADTIAAVAAIEGRLAGLVAHSFGAAAASLALSRGAAVDRVAYVAPMVSPRSVVDAFVRFVGLSPAAAAVFEQRLAAQVGDAVEVDGRTLALTQTRPLLVVHDQDDKETSIAGSEQLVAAWRDAELVRTRGLGHRRILREEGVLARVAQFVHAPAPALRTQSELEIIERDLFDRESRRRRAFP